MWSKIPYRFHCLRCIYFLLSWEVWDMKLFIHFLLPIHKTCLTTLLFEYKSLNTLLKNITITHTYMKYLHLSNDFQQHNKLYTNLSPNTYIWIFKAKDITAKYSWTSAHNFVKFDNPSHCNRLEIVCLINLLSLIGSTGILLE